MGKAVLFVVIATIIGGSYVLFQSNVASVETDKRQAERQYEMLAREIARSGLSRVLATTRQLDQQYPDASMGQIVQMVNGAGGAITGAYQGGEYRAWIYQASPSAFGAMSEGMIITEKSGAVAGGDQRGTLVDTTMHRIPGGQRTASGIIPDQKVPQVTVPSRLEVEFLESMAGYCSAIFLQRLVPKNNNGHGNNCDGVDGGNPGGSKEGEDSDPGVDDECNVNGKSRWRALEPELIFAPGNNRDGAAALYDAIIDPGTRLNFILAVDADNNCEMRGQTVDVKNRTFNYTRDALLDDVSDLNEMLEGPYAMIQERPGVSGTWRIAFEDLKFSDDQLQDIKQNGYSNNSWNRKQKTYGGSGWNAVDSYGYYRLKDYGNKPDFSDQVIELTLTPVPPEELEQLADGGTD